MTETKRPGPRGGKCRYCELETGGLVVHERACTRRGTEAEVARMDVFLTRAATHARAEAVTPAAQRWREGVTDEDVAAVMYALEATDALFYRNPRGRWLYAGVGPWGAGRHRINPGGRQLSTIIGEMIRTGLVRHWVRHTPSGDRDHLIPARVHLRDPYDHRFSACKFPGEDMGPMRARLTDDLSIVDCLECELCMARGGPRGL